MKLVKLTNGAVFIATLLLAAMLSGNVARADSAATSYGPQAAEYSLLTLLSSARIALRELELLPDANERRLRCSTAITALSGLYQLHGCAWAKPLLKEVYTHPDCPDLHIGFSADGRSSLRLEPLELRNPAFADYTIYLCTLQGNTALDLLGLEQGMMAVSLLDGSELTAQPLGPAHELWPHLERLAHTFEAPDALPSGAGIAFKQIFAVENLCRERISTVSLVWGNYRFVVPYYENEVGL
jgi:hypothetical protein